MLCWCAWSISTWTKYVARDSIFWWHDRFWPLGAIVDFYRGCSWWYRNLVPPSFPKFSVILQCFFSTFSTKDVWGFHVLKICFSRFSCSEWSSFWWKHFDFSTSLSITVTLMWEQGPSQSYELSLSACRGQPHLPFFFGIWVMLQWWGIRGFLFWGWRKHSEWLFGCFYDSRSVFVNVLNRELSILAWGCPGRYWRYSERYSGAMAPL